MLGFDGMMEPNISAMMNQYLIMQQMQGFYDMPRSSGGLSQINPMGPPRSAYRSNPFGNEWFSPFLMQGAVQLLTDATGGSLQGVSGRGYHSVMRDLQRATAMQKMYSQAAQQNVSSLMNMGRGGASALGLYWSPESQMRTHNFLNDNLAPMLGPMIASSPEIAQIWDSLMGQRGSAESMASRVFPAASYRIDPMTKMQLTPAQAANFTQQMYQTMFGGEEQVDPRFSALQLGKLYSNAQIHGMLDIAEPAEKVAVSNAMSGVAERQSFHYKDINYLDQNNRDLMQLTVQTAEAVRKGEPLNGPQQAALAELTNTGRFSYMFEDDMPDEVFDYFRSYKNNIGGFNDPNSIVGRLHAFRRDSKVALDFKEYDLDEYGHTISGTDRYRYMSDEVAQRVKKGKATKEDLAGIDEKMQQHHYERMRDLVANTVVKGMNHVVLKDLGEDAIEVIDKMTAQPEYEDLLDSVQEYMTGNVTRSPKEEAEMKQQIQEKFRTVAKAAGLDEIEAETLVINDTTLRDEARSREQVVRVNREMTGLRDMVSAGREIHTEMGGDPEDIDAIFNMIDDMYGNIRSVDKNKVARELREMKELAQATGTGLQELIDATSSIAAELRSKGMDGSLAAGITKGTLYTKQALQGNSWATGVTGGTQSELIEYQTQSLSKAMSSEWANNVGIITRVAQRDLQSGETDTNAVKMLQAFQAGETTVQIGDELVDTAQLSKASMRQLLTEGRTDLTGQDIAMMERNTALNSEAFKSIDNYEMLAQEALSSEAKRKTSEWSSRLEKALDLERRYGWTSEDRDEAMRQIMSGDYANLNEMSNAIFEHLQVKNDQGIFSKRDDQGNVITDENGEIAKLTDRELWLLTDNMLEMSDAGMRWGTQGESLEKNMSLFNDRSREVQKGAAGQSSVRSIVSKSMEGVVGSSFLREFSTALQENVSATPAEIAAATLGIQVDSSDTIVGEMSVELDKKTERLNNLYSYGATIKDPEKRRENMRDIRQLEGEIMAAGERLGIGYNYVKRRGAAGVDELREMSREDQLKTVYGDYFEEGLDGEQVEDQLKLREQQLSQKGAEDFDQGKSGWEFNRLQKQRNQGYDRNEDIANVSDLIQLGIEMDRQQASGILNEIYDIEKIKDPAQKEKRIEALDEVLESLPAEQREYIEKKRAGVISRFKEDEAAAKAELETQALKAPESKDSKVKDIEKTPIESTVTSDPAAAVKEDVALQTASATPDSGDMIGRLVYSLFEGSDPQAIQSRTGMDTGELSDILQNVLTTVSGPEPGSQSQKGTSGPSIFKIDNLVVNSQRLGPATGSASNTSIGDLAAVPS